MLSSILPSSVSSARAVLAMPFNSDLLLKGQLEFLYHVGISNRLAARSLGLLAMGCSEIE